MLRCLNIYNYRHLIQHKAWADFRASSERTYLGILWWVLEPLITMGIFYLVFAVFLQHRREDFLPFLLIALTIWRWFERSVTQASRSISKNATFVDKVDLPKLIFPVMAILTQSIHFVFSLAILVLVLGLTGVRPDIYNVGFLAVLAVLLGFIFALSLPVAAIVPFVPDVDNFLGHLLRIMFYLSGIFYDGRDLPEHLQPFFWLNPMAVLIDGGRLSLLYETWPSWRGLGIIGGVSLVGLYVGALITHRFDKVYAKAMMR